MWSSLASILLSAAASCGGEEACADCHGEIAASQARTAMARALEPIRPEMIAGLGAVLDRPAGWRYRFQSDARGTRLLEEWYGPDGQPRGSPEEVELAFAIGAGRLDRSFAARRGAFLWFAPVEVVSAQGEVPRHAALAPGHMQHSGLRWNVPIGDECLGCHTDALPRERFPRNAEDRAWTPRGLGCAACHPSGGEHARWQASSEAQASGEDPIRAEARLGPLERLSACSRCHLQGDARVPLDPGARGLPPHGEDLLRHVAVFTAAHAGGDIGFVSQTERLVESRCFSAALGSPKAMTCESCHDPHRSIDEPRERARVRAACLECHAEGVRGGPQVRCSLPVAERGARDCASCHMRLTPPFDVAGVEIHDHRIERRPPPPSKFERVRLKQTLDGELARFAWPGREPPARGDPGLELMALVGAERLDRAAALVDAKGSEAIEALPNLHHARGLLLERTGRLTEAIASYRRALELDPTFADPRINLGLILPRAGQTSEAKRLLDEVLAEWPLAEGALRNRAVLRLGAGDADGFRADLEAAQALLPRPENARALASFFQRAGSSEVAERWRAEAARLDPSRP